MKMVWSPTAQSSSPATFSSAGTMLASRSETSTDVVVRDVGDLLQAEDGLAQLQARTNVPLPWVVVTRPRSRRMLMARRTVMGLTPNSLRSSASVGS